MTKFKAVRDIPLWAHILLVFKTLEITRWDQGNGKVSEIQAKTLFGVRYILKITEYILPPEHFNCRCAKVRVGTKEA